MPAAEMILPITIVLLINLFSWRYAWLFAGLSILIFFIPLIFILLNNHKKRHKDFLKKNNNSFLDKNWEIREIIKDKKFYIYLPIYLTPAFVITGLIFHQLFIGEYKDWSKEMIATSFIGYAFFSIIGLFLGGPVIDKFNTKKLIPFLLLPMLISMLLLMFVQNNIVIYYYMALMGLTHGLHRPFTGSLWAELYGVLNLGALRSLLHACGVFASALSPFILGVFIDYNFSPFFLSFFCFCLIIIVSIAPFIFRNN